MTTLYNSLKENGLIDKHGLVSLLTQKEETDNGALYTAYALNLMHKQEADMDEIYPIYEATLPLVDQKGMTHRRPGDNDQDSPDNIIGLCSIDPWYAKRIYGYGRTTFPRFIYNNSNPGKFTLDSWLGRQIGLIGYMQMMSGSWVNPLRFLVLWAGMWLTAQESTEKTSDRLLAQLMVDTMPNTWYTKPLKHWWNMEMLYQYGAAGMNAVVKKYFGPDHPFSSHWY